MFIWEFDVIVDSTGTGTAGLQVRNDYSRVTEESPGQCSETTSGGEAEPASASGFGGSGRADPNQVNWSIASLQPPIHIQTVMKTIFEDQ